MRVTEAKECVAYHFKQKLNCIAGSIQAGDTRFDLSFMKRYVVSLVDRANKTKTQKRIRKEVLDSRSLDELLCIVQRVVANGDATEFVDYAGAYR